MFDWKKIFSLLNSQKEDVICNKNRSKKVFFTGHEQLTLSAGVNVTADEVTKTAYNILLKYKDNPGVIFRYMATQGTQVITSKSLFTLIKILGYEEGFIPKHKGLKAFILNLAIQKVKKEKINFSMTLPDTFLICKKDLSLYFLAYNLHHWISYKNNLPGYDYNTLCLFKSTFNNSNSNLSALNINQILSIKDAIERDKQSLDFVIKFVREQVGAKDKLQKIINGNTVSI